MKRKALNILLAVTAGALIFTVGIGVWVIPSKGFSEEENRALATLSAPTLQSLADGEFSEELSAFFCDKLPCRISLIRLRALSEIALLKGECNGVIFCRDGYLLNRGEYASLDAARESIAEISELSASLEESGVPVSIVYVPRAIDVMESKLPYLYDGSQDSIFGILPEDSLSSSLLTDLKAAARNGEYVWFKTDHHWTSHGAYIAYVHIISALGQTPYSRNLFTVETVSEDFLGSIYSRAGCIAPSPDKVELYRYEGDTEYTVTLDDGRSYRGLYFSEFLEEKDKYSVFLGGNYSYLSIKKEGAENRSRLVIIKDSYANALVPFLALHFDIEMIDPRFYRGYEEICTMIKDADRVLIIQGLDTVAT